MASNRCLRSSGRGVCCSQACGPAASVCNHALAVSGRFHPPQWPRVGIRSPEAAGPSGPKAWCRDELALEHRLAGRSAGFNGISAAVLSGSESTPKPEARGSQALAHPGGGLGWTQSGSCHAAWGVRTEKRNKELPQNTTMGQENCALLQNSERFAKELPTTRGMASRAKPPAERTSQRGLTSC